MSGKSLQRIDAQTASSARVGELVSEFLRGGWRAECSCGWFGVAQSIYQQAEGDLARHIAERRPEGPSTAVKDESESSETPVGEPTRMTGRRAVPDTEKGAEQDAQSPEGGDVRGGGQS